MAPCHLIRLFHSFCFSRILLSRVRLHRKAEEPLKINQKHTPLFENVETETFYPTPEEEEEEAIKQEHQNKCVTEKQNKKAEKKKFFKELFT